MKIADATIEIMKKEDIQIIIPFLDESICFEILKLANKRESKGKGLKRIQNTCRRVANALEKDKRFKKFIHVTGKRAFELKD